MCARSSSTKIWGWAVTRRTRLNGLTIPMQGPTLDAQLAAMGLNGLASSVCLWFVEASPTVEKTVLCYKADRLVASLLSFHSILCRRLQYANFVLQGKSTANKATDGCVRTFDAWCHVPQSASEQLQLCELSGPTFGFTMWEFSMVGGYTENPEKPQNCQNWVVGACTGMGACSGQYGIFWFLH